MTETMQLPYIVDGLQADQPTPMDVPLEQIQIGETQLRVSTNHDAIREYADAIERGEELPYPALYFDGEAFWIGDGHHRIWAYHNLFDQSTIPSDVVIRAHVYQGGKREALLHAAGANAAHGLRRSNADKRNAVTTLLQDDEWSEWSNREIARRCGVDEKLVRTVRDELAATAAKPQSSERRGADGRVIDTANIGTRPAEASGRAVYMEDRPTPAHVPPESEEETPQILRDHGYRLRWSRINDGWTWIDSSPTRGMVSGHGEVYVDRLDAIDAAVEDLIATYALHEESKGLPDDYYVMEIHRDVGPRYYWLAPYADAGVIRGADFEMDDGWRQIGELADDAWAHYNNERKRGQSARTGEPLPPLAETTAEEPRPEPQAEPQPDPQPAHTSLNNGFVARMRAARQAFQAAREHTPDVSNIGHSQDAADADRCLARLIEHIDRELEPFEQYEQNTATDWGGPKPEPA